MEVMSILRFSEDSGYTKFMRNSIRTILHVLQQLLLAKGANMKAMNNDGDTVIAVAKTSRHVSIIRLLHTAGNGRENFPSSSTL